MFHLFYFALVMVLSLSSPVRRDTESPAPVSALVVEDNPPTTPPPPPPPPPGGVVKPIGGWFED